jgi:hypothetical protein
MFAVAGSMLTRAREAEFVRVDWAWRGMLALCAIANMVGSWSYGLLDDNEGLYAAIAREMLIRGDWIVPHLNGVPYLEKPPLLYWAVAFSLRLFGDHEWAIRIVPWAFHVGTAALTSRLAFRLGGRRAGRLAALIFLSSAGVAMIDRTLLFDVPMTFFLTAALAAWQRWDEEGRPGALRWAAAALALAVLSKGLVALALAGGTVGITLAVDGRLRRLASLLDPWAILIFLLVAVPWHVAAAALQPGFAWFYFVNEHVLRFLGLRKPRDYARGPLWYYLVRVPLYLFPWSLLLPRLDPPDRRNGREAFLWAWAGCVILFFSVCGSKSNYYALPAVPPLVALLALRLGRDADRKPSLAHKLLVVTGIVPVLAAVVVVSTQEDRWSQRPLAERVKSAYSGLPVYLYRDFEAVSSLPYYLGGRVTVIDCASCDLRYGLHLCPRAGAAITATGFLARTHQTPALVAVRPRNRIDFLRTFPQARPLPLRSRGTLLFSLGPDPRRPREAGRGPRRAGFSPGRQPPSPATRTAR